MEWHATADEALKMWIHVQSGGDQLRSLTLVDSEEVCCRPSKGGICAGKKSIRGRGLRLLYVCATCGQPWKGTMRAIFEPKHRKAKSGLTVRVRGKVPRVRREGLLPLETAADIRRYLRPVFETRPYKMTAQEWHFCLKALELKIHADEKLSYPKAAEIGLAMFPDAAAAPRRWWSEWHVRTACADARQEIEKRLARQRRGGLWNDGWESARQQSGSASVLGTSAA